MKVVFDKETFLSALYPAMATVSNKNTIASLEGVLIECCENNSMTISSYDMKKGVISKTEAIKTEKAGCHIIPAQRLMQIVRLMPVGPITLEILENETATISSLSGHFSLKAQRGEDFPSLPEMNKERFFSVKAGVLKRVIGKVLHSIAENDIKAMLCGAFFSVSESGLEVVSCNNFMLSKCHVCCEVSHAGENQSPLSFIVPGHALQELVKLLPDGEEPVAVELTGKHVVFKTENIVFFTRLIEENYMDYKRIIPSGYPISVTINRDLFIEGLERVNLIAEEKTQGNIRSYVKIHVNGTLFEMSAVSASGNAFEEISCEHTGDDLQIGFNGKFLMSCLRVIESEDVVLTLKSATQSMTIEPLQKKEGEDLFYMVLPLRMNQ